MLNENENALNELREENANLVNAINDISSINQNIQNFTRRALELQNQINTTSTWNQIFSARNFKRMMYSSQFFIVGGIILSLITPMFLYNILSIPDDNKTFSLLESEEMNINYFLLILIVFIFLWGTHLFISNIIFKFDYSNFNFDFHRPQHLMAVDGVYFNPFFFCLLVWYFRKSYFQTGFDVCLWVLFSIIFFFNFIFTSNLYIYMNIKISQITNTMLDENRIIIRRFRIYLEMLIAMNMIYLYFLKGLIDESDYAMRYILIFKGIYLFCKQIEYFVVVELSYKYLMCGTNIKEENFIRNLSVKSKLQILNMLLILHKLLLASLTLLSGGQLMLFFFPLLMIIINLIYNIMQNYNAYKRIKNFYNQLEDLFPKIALENEEECIICMESIVNARKLSCNHYFHLICLSKWIEKGNKNCPMCRKEIDFQNNNVNARSNAWTFGVRLDSRLFSWIPNISLSITRRNINDIQQNNIQNHENIPENVDNNIIN